MKQIRAVAAFALATVKRLRWCLLLLAVLLVFRFAPHAALKDSVPLSTAVLDSQGRLLRLTLAADGQVRIWTPLVEIPAPVIESVLLQEDQYFYWHLGVNPAALGRAIWQSFVKGHRQGASTITMQLVRLRSGLYTRAVGGKLNQIIQAIGLELRYSKAEILEAYLNLAPYGGNVQGVGTASFLYFSKPLAHLDLAQTLGLAVLPQAPRQRAPRQQENAHLRAARLRLMHRWLLKHPESLSKQRFLESPLRFSGSRLPFIAPHFCNQVLAQTPTSASRIIHSTLNRRLQNLTEARVQKFVNRRLERGVHNAAALLVDTRTMAVVAQVGSANYFSAQIDGQVDGTRARRSPGSTLKPFLYALAMDQGIIHPLTVLKDAPSNFGAYAPENHDGGFLGPLSAHDALIRSRNVPTVELAFRTRSPSLYQMLKNAEVALPRTERHYGLALALGGGEVTMQELAALYAALANRGQWQPLRWTETESPLSGRRLFSEEASFMVADILKDNPRPDELLYKAPRGRLPVAWKTGTSWGFRDAWAAGFFGPYVLVVWVGNFDGQGNPEFVGVKTAAPLFFDLIDAIKRLQPALVEPVFKAPIGIAKVAVCVASGQLPNADCPQTQTTWFIPGKSPISVSTIHRRIPIDTRTGLHACPDTPERYLKSEVYEFWPSDLMRLFSQAGIPRRRPPAAGKCNYQETQQGQPPQIVSPMSQVRYVLDPNQLGKETLALRAHADASVTQLYWFVNSAYIGHSKPAEALAWQPSNSGSFRISVVDAHNRRAERTVVVELR